jgi:hypothetical protein
VITSQAEKAFISSKAVKVWWVMRGSFGVRELE